MGLKTNTWSYSHSGHDRGGGGEKPPDCLKVRFQGLLQGYSYSFFVWEKEVRLLRFHFFSEKQLT